MSFIGATGYNENQEQFDILKDEIDANASYINNLVGIPDPLHTAIFGINVLNPGLFGLVERAEVNIKALQTGLEGEGTTISGIETTISGIETTISGIETEVSGIQTEILGIQGEITGIDSTISSIEFVQLPALGTALTALIGATDVIAVDARNKANRALDIWDYSGDNVYHKKSGNVGIGTTFGSTLTNKLEVQGNINIPTGSTFRINNVNFGYSNLDHKLLAGTNINIDNDYKINNTYTYTLPTAGVGAGGALGGVKVDGSTITITNGIISGANTYTLPTAGVGAGGTLGGVKVDGTTINITNGVISGANTYTLPTAGVGTGGTLGGVKVDGTTINITNGVISSTAGLPATIRLTPTPTDGFYSWINSQALLAKTPSTGVLYSSGSADGDIVLRSDTDKALILQSGIGDPAITLTAGLNRVRIHQRVGINTLPNTNYWLDVNGSINATEIRVGGNLIPISQWITSGANIYYSSGNVGIGTNANISGVLLDVNGTIESRTGIGANSVFYFRGVANSDINRVISAGQHSTNSAVNDMVIRSTNKLVLQSGITAPSIVIDTANNVGIGKTNPQTNMKLDINGNLRVEENIFFGTGYNGGGRDFPCNKINLFSTTREYGFGISGDTLDYFSFSNHRFFTGSGGGFTSTNFGTERMRITGTGNIYTAYGSGNFGVGVSPSYKCHIKCSYGDIATGLHLDADDAIPPNNPNKYSLTIWPYVIAGGSVGWRFRTQNLNGGTNTPFEIAHDGSVRFQVDRWHADSDGIRRLYFQSNEKTYITGGNGTDIVEFRQNTDTMRARINANGQFACHFQTIPSLNTDHIGVNSNTGENSFGYYFIHVLYNTFTGYHRCYYEDDDIFNNDMSKEEIDIFKNNYNGRIVISTGKIKTDLSRTIPNVEEEENEMNRPTNYEETKNESPNVEWYSGIDKDGITIEEAIPIVQLCRVKKDKRVYGVLGSADRKTNNKNRLIVNSVGEGAICVCNTNGNIENGDYIQSSELLGFGEKQDDDILHNYSVAKAVMDCNFDLDSPYYQCYELEGGVRVAFIACTYHCG